jgi:hypothetical protein
VQHRIRRAAGFGFHAGDFGRLEIDIGRAIDQNPHAELVDNRHFNRTGLGEFDTGKSACGGGSKTG